MFRTTCWARVLGLTAFLASRGIAAEEEEKWAGKLVECGADNVVIFKRSLSPDGRYAVGWTLHSNKPNAKPVDWSQWGKGDDFFGPYDFFIPQIVGTGGAPLVDAAKALPDDAPASWKSGTPYELVDGVVDLKKKTFLPLPSLWPYWPGKNHGDLSAIWSGDRLVVINEARFFTADVWLVRVSDQGLGKIKLLPALKDAALDILEEKRPLVSQAYAISWFTDSENKTGLVFSKSTVRLPFNASIPKSDYEPVQGTVTVNLVNGKVVKKECTTKRDNPFLDNPDLAKANTALTKVYKELLAKLGKDQRDALEKEEAQWFFLRDYGSPLDAGSFLSAGVLVFQGKYISSVPGGGDDPVEFAEKRDLSLIRSTKERTEELKMRLSSK
jgi:hypothetical protein